MDPEVYRELILTEHGALNEALPKRYKRFIVSGDDTHGAIQATAPSPSFPFPQPFLFYTQEANGTSLSYWAAELVRIGQRQSRIRLERHCRGLRAGSKSLTPGVDRLRQHPGHCTRVLASPHSSAPLSISSTVLNSTLAPLAISWADVNSCGEWLMPFSLGTKIMPVGAISAMSCAS